MLEAVTAARNAAVTAHGPAPQGPAELAPVGAVRGMRAVAEGYPALKAGWHLLVIQEELGELEGRIGYARQFNNNAVQTLPRIVFARCSASDPASSSPRPRENATRCRSSSPSLMDGFALGLTLPTAMRPETIRPGM
jgi:hypothetical protein